MNALWWVRYRDNPNAPLQLLSLSSPDLRDPKAATRRAASTARARLKARGIKKPVIVAVSCVG